MYGWYEVFDNEDVHFLTRKQGTHLGMLFMLVLGMTIVGLALGQDGHVAWAVVLPLVGLLWGGTLVWTVYRLRRLRRIVWCIKISDRHVVGYDYHRRRTIIDWIRVQRIELTKHGLTLVTDDHQRLEIPHLFSDYGPLSHSLLRAAEVYETPIYVDGKPWEELDVYSLYPFLPEQTTGSPPPADLGN